VIFPPQNGVGKSFSVGSYAEVAIDDLHGKGNFLLHFVGSSMSLLTHINCQGISFGCGNGFSVAIILI
jgi:hypothetical protein